MTEFDNQPTLIGNDGEPRVIRSGSFTASRTPYVETKEPVKLSAGAKAILTYTAIMATIAAVVAILIVVKYFQIKHGLQDIGDTITNINLDPSPTP
jgi:cell division protein FtsL